MFIIIIIIYVLGGTPAGGGRGELLCLCDKSVWEYAYYIVALGCRLSLGLGTGLSWTDGARRGHTRRRCQHGNSCQCWEREREKKKKFFCIRFSRRVRRVAAYCSRVFFRRFSDVCEQTRRWRVVVAASNDFQKPFNKQRSNVLPRGFFFFLSKYWSALKFLLFKRRVQQPLYYYDHNANKTKYYKNNKKKLHS